MEAVKTTMNSNRCIALDSSLKGRLKRYANPALLEKESSAWENHIAEKMQKYLD